MTQRSSTFQRSGAAIAMCLALFASSFARAADETARPNVVVFLVDDLGWTDLGCYGSTFYETPNIDRLAARGVRFTDAYAACPVCSPSRAALLTGKSPARLGMTAHVGDASGAKDGRPLATPWSLDRLDHPERTLAEVLHDAGYATMHAGKWHMGHEPYYPEYHGFDVNAGGWLHGGPFTGKGYFSPYANPRLSDGPDGEYLTERLAEETSRFIRAHRHEPFFVQHSFYQVHVPLQAREEAIRKYEAKRDALPPVAEELIQGRDSLERARQDMPVYAAMVEALDSAVGRVLRAIEEAGVADRTIVVFTSDNGGLSTGDAWSDAQGRPTTNRPLRAGKGWVYEGGVRVPLIAAGPGVGVPGSSSARVVNGTDHFATIVELAGLDEPIPADSASYAAALKGDPTPRGPVFWHYPHYGNQGGRPAGAVRDGQWKLVEWYGPTPERPERVELYDLSADLGEVNDLACEQTDVARRLLESLATYRREVDARMPSASTPRVTDSKPDKVPAKTTKR